MWLVFLRKKIHEILNKLNASRKESSRSLSYLLMSFLLFSVHTTTESKQ